MAIRTIVGETRLGRNGVGANERKGQGRRRRVSADARRERVPSVPVECVCCACVCLCACVGTALRERGKDWPRAGGIRTEREIVGRGGEQRAACAQLGDSGTAAAARERETKKKRDER